jgi:fumarate hydratase subunit beta
MDKLVEYHLKTPISEADVRRLNAGDIIYVTGTVFTARDEAHLRALEYYKKGKKLPMDLSGLVLYHCGPIVRKIDEKWEVVAAGPTTSTRMEPLEQEFMTNFSVRVVVGKGGMGPKTTEAMRKFGAVYCALTGGTALLAAKAIRKVERVEWLDLGIPEAIWIFDVEDFGPLIVGIDAHGRNLYNDVMKEVEDNRKKIYEQIG